MAGHRLSGPAARQAGRRRARRCPRPALLRPAARRRRRGQRQPGIGRLLDAAVAWSRAGDSRVLLTSRLPDFNHPDYPTAGSFEHQRLALDGLAPQDALDWFAELMRRPPKPAFGLPKRGALLALFAQVDYHPLSIGLLAQQLRERRPAELGERLEALLDAIPVGREDRSLLASLELSLESGDATAFARAMGLVADAEPRLSAQQQAQVTQLMQQAGGDPAKLDQALAEESLTIKETIDPAAAEIWTTYNLLAQIAAKQDDAAGAAGWRAQARRAQAGFAGTRQQLRQHGDLMTAVLAAIGGDEQARDRVKQYQQAMRQADPDWSALAAALDRVLAGDRDPALVEPLGPMPGIILETILSAITNPATLDDLLSTADADTPPPTGPATPATPAALPEPLRQLATAIAAAVQQPELRPPLEPLWQQLREQGGGALVTAVEALYADHSDPARLFEASAAGLDEQEQAILGAVARLLA